MYIPPPSTHHGLRHPRNSPAKTLTAYSWTLCNHILISLCFSLSLFSGSSPTMSRYKLDQVSPSSRPFRKANKNFLAWDIISFLIWPLLVPLNFPFNTSLYVWTIRLVVFQILRPLSILSQFSLYWPALYDLKKIPYKEKGLMLRTYPLRVLPFPLSWPPSLFRHLPCHIHMWLYVFIYSRWSREESACYLSLSL